MNGSSATSTDAFRLSGLIHHGDCAGPMSHHPEGWGTYRCPKPCRTGRSVDAELAEVLAWEQIEHRHPGRVSKDMTAAQKVALMHEVVARIDTDGLTEYLKLRITWAASSEPAGRR